MKTIIQKLNTPLTNMVFVMAGGIFMLLYFSSVFRSEMAEDRAVMVAALREAQTSEPQIAAISRMVERTTSHTHSIAITFFTFNLGLIAAAFWRKDHPKQISESSDQVEGKHAGT